MTTSGAVWIAVDWGTTNLRAWSISPVGVVSKQSAKGAGRLAPGDFESELLSFIDEWLAEDTCTPVVICGMAGAREGWAEAGYVKVPAPPPNVGNAVVAPTNDPRISARILPGISQTAPPDVMRGEETQIGGFLSKDPEFDGVLCLPGTHSKWVHISAGEIVSFRTYMTGELFNLLRQHSILRSSVSSEDWSDDDFIDALTDAIAKPERLSASLFALRASKLLGQGSSAALAKLSGLLVGSELADARPYWLGREVVVVGETTLTARYQTALQSQGLTPEVQSGGELALLGLTQAIQSEVA